MDSVEEKIEGSQVHALAIGGKNVFNFRLSEAL